MALFSWGVLGLAGLLEIAWAVGIRYTEHWTRPIPSVLVATAYVMCLYLLSVAMRHIPSGTAYAVWVGIGTVGVVVWGILFFGESTSIPRLLCIALILAGVVGLKLAP